MLLTLPCCVDLQPYSTQICCCFARCICCRHHMLQYTFNVAVPYHTGLCLNPYYCQLHICSQLHYCNVHPPVHNQSECHCLRPPPLMCLFTHAGVFTGKATLVSQYRAALEGILEQPCPRPYRSAQVTEPDSCIADSDFFIGSHPELTPRYTQGVALMRQTGSMGQVCSSDAALVTVQLSRQCNNSRHRNVQYSKQYPVPTLFQSDDVRHSLPQPVFGPEICQHADQLPGVHASSACLDAASNQQSSRLAYIQHPYRYVG